MFESFETILVLAPHTDDGELACGGLISRLVSEKKRVYYAAFSSCATSLPKDLAADTLIKECNAATAVLGIPGDQVHIYDFPVRHFPAIRQDILEELVSLHKKIKPDLVLLPSADDIHQDHRVIHEEGRRAFKNCSVLGYELPWNHATFPANLYVTLTGEQLDRKIAALHEYRSQSHRNYMQDDFIRSLAKVRGVQANTLLAEAFVAYRLQY